MLNKVSFKQMLGGLDGNLGIDDYSEPLNILVDSINNNNKLNPLSSIAFKNQLKDRFLVRQKLHKFISHKNFPDPAAPIFVIGLPRSGTTFLFNLLSLDNNHRSPLYWEIMNPLPLVKNNKQEVWRKRKINLELKFARVIIPKLKNMHHIRAETPEECELIATMNVRSFVYICMANIPEYVEYLKNCSFTSVFEWHKKFFQMLECSGRPNRWLLKDPSHIGHIPEIITTYPNAKFINIHRSPIESIGSFCSLTKNIRSTFSKYVESESIGETVLDFWQHSLNKGIEDRKVLPDNQIADIAYSEFINSPINSVKNVYEKLGLDLNIETENKMRDYLISQKSIKKEKHTYSLEEFNLSEEKVSKHFQNYVLNYKF